MAKYLRKPKVNIPMCAAAVLFCLTVISTHLVSGLYARYTTSGTGEDSARVIKFGEISITETGDFVDGTNDMLIVPGVDIEKKAVVNFGGSEAATYVFLEVELAGGWTYADGTFANGGLSWEMAEGWTYLAGSTHVFYKELAPNETLSAGIIKNDTITVSEDITKATIDALAGAITFRASAVQSHGFDSVDAAWASLSGKEGAA